MRVEWRSGARHELNEAGDWYDSQRPGLADALDEDVANLLASILENPQFGRSIDHRHRQRSLRIFPYSLVYRVQRGTLVIVALQHDRRRPGYWLDDPRDVREMPATYLVSQGKEPEEWAPNEPVDSAWEAAWDKEFDRRWAEYEAGLVDLIPHEQVFAEIVEEPG
jgi:plasmid stabilization system protein ParE